MHIQRPTREQVAIALIMIAPAVIVPDALNRFVFGKLFVAALGAALACTVPARGRLSQHVRLLLGGAALLLAISAAISDSPWAAFLGRSPRYEGVLVLATYLLVALAGVRLLGPGRTPTATRAALGTMAGVALLVGFIALLESVGLRPLSTDLDRPGSLLGNASDEGAVMVLFAGPLLVDSLRRRRPLAIAGAVAAVTTVVLSASRGALIGLVVVLVVLAIVSVRRARWFVAGAAGAAAVLTLIVPFTRERVLGTTPLAGHTITGRNLLWRETLSLIGKHPVLGVGPSQYEVAIVDQHDRKWQSTVGPAFPPDSPHNWILQTLDSGGPLLLVLLLVLIVLLVRGRWTQLRDNEPWTVGSIAGLGGYGAALLFHLTSPGTTIPALVLAGAALAVPLTQARTRWLPYANACLAGVLALAFLLAGVGEIVLRHATIDVARGNVSAADSGFDAVRALRPWDVDLPAAVTHEYAVSASAGNTAAIALGDRWLRRVHAVAQDEQVVEDHALLEEAAKHYSAARAILTGQLVRDPYNPLLVLRLGVVEAELSNYPAAERNFVRASRISSDSPEPWQDLATLYTQLGETSKAKSAQLQAHRRGG